MCDKTRKNELNAATARRKSNEKDKKQKEIAFRFVPMPLTLRRIECECDQKIKNSMIHNEWSIPNIMGKYSDLRIEFHSIFVFFFCLFAGVLYNSGWHRMKIFLMDLYTENFNVFLPQDITTHISPHYYQNEWDRRKVFSSLFVCCI